MEYKHSLPCSGNIWPSASSYLFRRFCRHRISTLGPCREDSSYREGMKLLESYLLDKYSPHTVKIYLLDINRYLQYMGKERAERATYQDVMEYVDYLRKGFSNPVTINRMLYAVKAWYFYLITEGKRGDHPCRQLRLKDARSGDIQLHDFFTSIELEKLMHR